MQEYLLAHWLDITTTILGLAYILFEYRASVWMWFVGLTMQALGIVLYYQKGLYADCGMEAYYILMTFYGLWKWTARDNKQQGTVERAQQGATERAKQNSTAAQQAITHIPLHLALRWGGIALALWAAIYYILVTFTDSTVPLADSFTTAFSLVGVWALAHKYLEQWFVWVAVDIVTCVLYFYKDIPFKASLYGLYVVIAILGYFKWKKMLSR
ncbi:MAG: nicotinamide mononucleotide transporter [Prevotella sp.]|nr:nicotinamide mononucleotide transporter [Prevotella sp.]